MNSATVQINELRLRAPGLTREQGRQLGEAVARRLAETPLNMERSREISELSLRVSSAGGGSVERMADEIAARIRK